MKPETGNRKLITGFTLIELMIVITIITILVTIGVTSFTTSQKKARDSRRKSDVRDIQTALEQYFAVCGYVYITPGATGQWTSINCGSPAISIMPTVPTDPLSTPYLCPTVVATSCVGSQYTVCTNLESETPSSYCLHNQQ